MEQLSFPEMKGYGLALSPVVQDVGPGGNILLSDLALLFTFYATFDSDSGCSYIPAGTSVLLPASSYARCNLRKPRLPSYLLDVAADCGGYVASRIWGEYRYTLEQYVVWLRSFSPRWAATMDYCCEPDLEHLTLERQEKTTLNVGWAWQHFRQESWAWVPTIQGWLPSDYKRHAATLKPLIEDMQVFYRENPAWRVGIGTLCRRDSVVAVQAIVNAVREVLPMVPLHLWGIKLDALAGIDLTNVTSSDSAVWHQSMYARDEIKTKAEQAGISMRRYKVLVNLPAYEEKVRRAVEESYRVQAAQRDHVLLQQVRLVLKSQGWTINIRSRRNRHYVYAARRNGKHVEQISICPVSELASWLQRESLSVVQGSGPGLIPVFSLPNS